MQSSHILLAVHDAFILETLQKSGFLISSAPSLREIWETASSALHDTIIVELEPSNRDDFFALQNTSRLPMPMIVISELMTDEIVLSMLTAGVFALLEKPLKADKCEKIVKAAQESREQGGQMEIISAIPSWIEVHIPAQQNYVTRLTSFLEPIIAPLFKAESNKVFIAFRELVQNAIEHGSSFSLRKKVFIRYVRTQYFIMFQIEDQGAGFDFHSLPHAAIGCSGKNAARDAIRYRKQCGMRPGGLGISYAVGAVDEVLYNQKGNAVALIKYLGTMPNSDK